MERRSNKLIQNIFRCHEAQLKSKRLPVKHLQAIDAIVSCRTADRGTSVYHCEAEDKTVSVHHACKHRSCWLCAQERRFDWVEAQQSRLLDCSHFHAVFTLPEQYRVLWQYNQRWFTQALFASVSSVLQDLIKQRHDITAGLLLALHTWGRQLSLHPHIHCVVSAGGLDGKGEWLEVENYLLPGKQVMALYRGRLQARLKEAFEDGEIRLPEDKDARWFYQLHQKVYRKNWCVRIEPKYAHGHGVMRYLSRYLRGGPINPGQIEHCNSTGVGFRYKDHRDQRRKLMHLTMEEFLRRVLLHVPEKGVHTVRHYGLYAGASREKRNRCREVVGGLMERVNLEPEPKQRLLCSCGAPLRELMTLRPRRKKGISNRKVQASIYVQPVDEPDIGQGKKKITALRL